MNEVQRENLRKAVAVVTAMDATRNDVTMSVDVVMSYFRDNATVSDKGKIDLGAVDLVSGLSMPSTALLALREDETGIGREQTLRGLALRLGA